MRVQVRAEALATADRATTAARLVAGTPASSAARSTAPARRTIEARAARADTDTAAQRPGGPGTSYGLDRIPPLPRSGTSLPISRPGDAREQDAERTAARVMGMSAPPGPCDCGGGCGRCSPPPAVSPPEQLQRHAPPDASLAPVAVPPAVVRALTAPGHPLDAPTRAFMEPRFAFDFGHVRLHTGAQASEAAAAVGAQAFTVGQDIVFAAGQHAPATAAGRRLLAHELAHVAQQRAGLSLSRSPSA